MNDFATMPNRPTNKSSIIVEKPRFLAAVSDTLTMVFCIIVGVLAVQLVRMAW